MPSFDEPARRMGPSGLGRRSFLFSAGALWGGLAAGCRSQKGNDAARTPPAPLVPRRGFERPQIHYDGRGDGLEWSGSRLAQVFSGGVRLWNRSSWKVEKEIPISPLLAFGTLADGSVTAITRTEEQATIVHIPPHGEPQKYRSHWPIGNPHQSLLLHLASPRQFFLIRLDSPQAELWELPQKPGSIQLPRLIAINPPEYSTVLALEDGSLAYVGTGGLHRITSSPARGEPPKRIVPWPLRSANILARGPSQAQLWAADRDGNIHLVRIEPSGPARVERTLKGPGLVYQLESFGRLVAALCVDPPDPGNEKWTLVVFDESGSLRMTATLPTEPPADILATPPRNRSLRLNEDLVAVGGPTELTVWEIGSGRVVHRSGNVTKP